MCEVLIIVQVCVYKAVITDFIDLACDLLVLTHIRVYTVCTICNKSSNHQLQLGFRSLLLEHCFCNKPSLYLTCGCFRHDVCEEDLEQSVKV